MNNLKIYNALQNNKMKKILATVISAKGSTPRGESSKMIFFEDGSECGTIGGGCVEIKTKQVAMELFKKQESCAEVFINLNGAPGQMSQDVCGGTMRIFLEKIL